jgi:hypothetical protein
MILHNNTSFGDETHTHSILEVMVPSHYFHNLQCMSTHTSNHHWIMHVNKVVINVISFLQTTSFLYYTGLNKYIGGHNIFIFYNLYVKFQP